MEAVTVTSQGVKRAGTAITSGVSLS